MNEFTDKFASEQRPFYQFNDHSRIWDYSLPYPQGSVEWPSLNEQNAEAERIKNLAGLDGYVSKASLWQIVRIFGAGVMAYHGYKRKKSFGWAAAWGLAGSAMPPVAFGIALFQGFGKSQRGD